MHIQRIKAKQGHPVPKTAHSPKGPFPSELFGQPESEESNTPYPDGEELPTGDTAQNDFRPVKWFKCKLCKDLIPEPQLGTHNCEVVHG